ncbi:MAG TPA: GatB/YqeY domain-containing protein [Rudaea sp.]
MSLKNQLSDDMKAAMKGGEKDKLGVIRLINAAIKQREVDERIALDDTQVLAVLEKMLKQRRDSVAQFEAAGRNDLADQEKFEIGVIQTYLPAQMTAEEVDAAIGAAISEAGASGPKDMGKVMGLVKPKVAGRTDMGKLSELVKAKLAALG